MSEDNTLSIYNGLVDQARSLGLTRYRTIQRFRPVESGPARIAQIESDIRAAQASAAAVASEGFEEANVVVVADDGIATSIEDAVQQTIQQEGTMAKTAKKTAKKVVKKAAKPAKAAGSAPAKRGRPPTNGTTIAAKTKEFNDLVPAAKKKGIAWAKVHTSFFGSHEAADAQIKRLNDAIKAA